MLVDRGQPTARQREVLDYIGESIANRGYPPTLREIAKRMGMSSDNAARQHIEALVRKGYVERVPLKARGLRLIAPQTTLCTAANTADISRTPPYRRPAPAAGR